MHHKTYQKIKIICPWSTSVSAPGTSFYGSDSASNLKVISYIILSLYFVQLWTIIAFYFGNTYLLCIFEYT